MPETRARISTSREPSAWPTASMEIGTFWVATRIVVTGSGGGAAPAAPALAEPSSCLPHAESRNAAALAARNARERIGFMDPGYYTYVQECIQPAGRGDAQEQG